MGAIRLGGQFGVVDDDVGDGITPDMVPEELQAFGSNAAQVREKGVVVGMFVFVGRFLLWLSGWNVQKDFGEGGRHLIKTQLYGGVVSGGFGSSLVDEPFSEARSQFYSQRRPFYRFVGHGRGDDVVVVFMGIRGVVCL